MVHRRFVIFGLACLLSTTAAVTVMAAEIRVMSFNIRYGSAQDGDNVWANRRDLVVDTIRQYNPDLLGTQETLPFQADYVREQLPEYEYVGWSRDTSENGEQCGILFRRERYQQVDAGQFWLSETPDEKFTKSWDSSLPRVVTWVKLQDKLADQKEILFVNTHFDHRGVEARQKSAELVRRWVEQQPADIPIVVTGDFNTAEKSQPWTTLTESERLADTYRAAYPQPQESEGTFHGFAGKPGSGRIDWILCSPQITVRQAEINRHQLDGRYPSDHFPVTAVLE